MSIYFSSRNDFFAVLCIIIVGSFVILILHNLLVHDGYYQEIPVVEPKESINQSVYQDEVIVVLNGPISYHQVIFYSKETNQVLDTWLVTEEIKQINAVLAKTNNITFMGESIVIVPLSEELGDKLVGNKSAQMEYAEHIFSETVSSF